jgi:hypothetical protein
MDDRRHLDFDTGRGRRQRRNLDEGACRTRQVERLPMRARHMGSIGHVENIDDGSHDVAQFRAGLIERGSHRGNRARHLLERVAIHMRCARRRA